MQQIENPFSIILQELAEIKAAIAIPREENNPIEVIDRKALCKRLAITEPTAIRWGKRGKIPEIHIGYSVRYNWPEVIKSLENQKK